MHPIPSHSVPPHPVPSRPAWPTLSLLDPNPDALAAALHAAADARDQAARQGSAGGAATWFDTWIAASFLAMAQAEVEWAVVECGLGGRQDSTNVFGAGGPCEGAGWDKPGGAELAVLTSVELEHTEVLGSSRTQIAREKV